MRIAENPDIAEIMTSAVASKKFCDDPHWKFNFLSKRSFVFRS